MQIPWEVKRVLEAAEETKMNEDTDKFWVVAKAVKEFVDNEGEGLLPLSSKLSDLTSTTEWYIKLQNIYNVKVGWCIWGALVSPRFYFSSQVAHSMH